VYTSGTTGFPKGAMVTGANLTAHAVAAGSVLGFGRDSAFMSGLGVYHAANLSFEVAALYHGGRVVMTRDTSPGALLDELEQRQVTHILVAPSTLSAFLEIPDVAGRDYGHLRSIMYGTTAIAPSLLRRCLDTFPASLTQGNGMATAVAE
jgi:acyl-CoA synthetase (AMP-forming)/AMP-acid ligase II